MSAEADPAVSFIVRTYNSGETLEAALRSIRAQTVPAEIVVVDSGSSDDTMPIAAGYDARIVHLPHERFGFGRALNLGAEAAAASVHAALSSHSVLPREDWAAIAAGHVQDGAAGTCGITHDAAGLPLDRPFRADHGYLLAHRGWGFTNHASAWSREAWKRSAFDEDLLASEDKEWSWRATKPDGYIVADPRLLVPGGHRRAAGTRDYYQRLVKEISSLHAHWPLEPYPISEALRDLARPVPLGRGISRARPFGRTRVIEVAARWTAGKEHSRPGKEHSRPGN